MEAQGVKMGYTHAPVIPDEANKPYLPLTPSQRLHWFVRSTVGWESLLVAGPIVSGWGTAFNRPHEYGPGWEGFGQRYGVRLLQVSADHAIEGSVGSLWGEDPRYYRTVNQPFKKRVVNILDLTVRAYRSDGERHIAYARLTADVSSNFLANTWLPDSVNDWQAAAWRSVTGLGSRAAGNAAREFLPEVMRWLRREHSSEP